MKQRLWISALFCIIAVIPLYSQQSVVHKSPSPKKLNQKVDEWVQGEVIFENGERRSCEFSYNPLVPEGLLKIKQGEKIITGTAFSVEAFSYYDAVGKLHRYYAVPVENRRYFLEYHYENSSYTILGRKSIHIRQTRHEYQYLTSKVNNAYQTFILDNKSGRISLLSSKKDLLKKLGSRKKELNSFIRKNNLRFKKTEDYILVLKEYEALHQ